MKRNRSLLYRVIGGGAAAAVTLGVVSVTYQAQAETGGHIMPGNCQSTAEPTPEESTAYGVPPGTAGVSTIVLWAPPTDPTYFENCLPQGYEYQGATWVNVSSPFTLNKCVDEAAGYCFWLVDNQNGKRVWSRMVLSAKTGAKPTPPPASTPGQPPAEFDCGGGKFTLDDAKTLATQAGLPSGLDQFLADPCANIDVKLNHVGGKVVDDPAGDMVTASATTGHCKLAIDHFVLNTVLNRFWTPEVARFDMVTSFCHDGQRVFKRGGGSIDPAAITNIEIQPFGRFYQAAYQGVDDAGIVSGLATFNGNPEGAFFTSRQSSWGGGIPILSFFWGEQDSVTSTQVVFANGRSTAYFGLFGHPEP